MTAIERARCDDQCPDRELPDEHGEVGGDDDDEA